MTKTCRKCGSTRVDEANGELSLASGKALPVYSVEKMAVCMECGFAEYRVSEGPLDQLRHLVSHAPEEQILDAAPASTQASIAESDWRE